MNNDSPANTSADASIELVIEGRRKDLGGFEVGRVLPWTQRRSVGPFVFFDHMGPVQLATNLPRRVDVRPHPHIGLSTITYLFAGEIVHRDSLGFHQVIRAGEVNWMTAGRGISHSERFETMREHGGLLHGIQAWIALPSADEEIAPAFVHHEADELPLERAAGATRRVIAGKAFGQSSPVRTHSPEKPESTYSVSPTGGALGPELARPPWGLESDEPAPRVREIHDDVTPVD